MNLLRVSGKYLKPMGYVLLQLWQLISAYRKHRKRRPHNLPFLVKSSCVITETRWN